MAHPTPARTPAAIAPSARAVCEVLLALGLTALPHLANLPATLSALFYALLAYHGGCVWQGRPLPNARQTAVLALTAALLAAWQAHGVFGHRAGTGLLLVAAALKSLELRSQRDWYLLVAVAYVLALTQFLFNQSLWMALYLSLSVWGLTAVLMGGVVNLPWRQRSRHSALLTLQALPLAVLLFILAPRFSQPFWSMAGERQALTGLSDHLEPGAVGSLIASDAVAFRVDFNGAIPPRAALYWRGPVFWYTDGVAWKMATPAVVPNAQAAVGAPLWRYSVILEPHGERWLLALDWPLHAVADSRLTGDYRLIASRPVDTRRMYSLETPGRLRWPPLPNAQRQLALQIPPGEFAALRPLVVSWRQSAGSDDAALLRLALAYFQTQGFHYSLNPPELPERPVERFVLETRSGFCEHYATALVVLMRLAGIPARVVTGYYGGHWNHVGGFLEVRQSDAHAWTEIWLSGQGWLRVDPTALLRPDANVDNPNSAAADASANEADIPAALNNHGWNFKRWRLASAAIEHAWHRWVLSYGAADRARLFDGLIELPWRVLSALAACVGGVIALIALRRNRLDDRSAALREYQRLSDGLAPHGLACHAGEAPLAYQQRLSQAHPAAAGLFEQFIQTYLAVRYADRAPPNAIAQLRATHRRLRRAARGW